MSISNDYDQLAVFRRGQRTFQPSGKLGDGMDEGL